MYGKRKDSLLLSLSRAFEFGKDYTASDVAAIIVSSVTPELLDEATYAIDHLRVGLVDLRVLRRSADGLIYTLRDEATLEGPGAKRLRKATRIAQEAGMLQSHLCVPGV